MIALTEKLLLTAGGWQAMKAARELLKADRVSEAHYEPPRLLGEVRDGTKKYRAGLRIGSVSEVENICTCRESREWGKICAHSLAVGLACLATPKSSVTSAPAAPSISATPRKFFPAYQPETTAVALHFILPPNFPSAWQKGQIMLCIEADIGERRLMLDALPSDLRAGLDERDLALVEQVGSGMNMLSAAAFLQLLPLLRGHERLTFGRSRRACVTEDFYRPTIIVSRSNNDYFEIGAATQPNEMFLLAGAAAWLLRHDQFLESGQDLPIGLTKILQGPLRLPDEAAREFFALEFPRWREAVEIILPGGMTLPTVVAATPRLALKIEGSLQHLRANLSCRYGDRPAFFPTAEPEKNFALRDPANPDQLLVRNLAAEMAAVARLEAAGFVTSELCDPARAARFFAFDLPALPNDWVVSIAPQLERTRDTLEPVAPTIEVVGSGEDWFELKYFVATAGGEHIPMSDVQRLLGSGNSRMRLKNGKQAVFDPAALEDFEQLLRDADPRQRQPGVYRFDKVQSGYLTNTAAEIGAKLIDVARALSRPATSALNLGTLGEKLRDYQLTGVAWLAALAEQKLGGILGDEMGLGKTVQTLALLRVRRGNGAALIVCPTSLLVNWQREAARFTPELRVVMIDGANRADKIEQLSSYDLGLTSYGLLRRDAELYSRFHFDSVVLDEAQHIKNPDTQNAQAAFTLRARQRFVLTGTPMENSVRDLWSLMNFVVPGYLGSRADFRERYEKPLTNRAEPVLQRRLARRLRPFLLRRKKADVAQELPAKIEQVVPCDLGPAQRTTYDALLREIQQGLGSGAVNNGTRRMKMLTGLLRLRQVCCDLRLLGLPPNDAAGASAKLDLLDELLEEIVDGGHRVLIFSQFVKMLDLLKERLIASATDFCYLAGLTTNRQEQVDRFQNEEAIPVFLISLKAGGVGLNLSAADTVIHFDPWWNAAVEAQATDRAHRIGQTRVVTSYKLIARDTVEEKILKLQNRKRELANAMLENEEPLMSGLTSQDLEELLTG